MTSNFALDSGIVIRVLRGDQRAKQLVSHLLAIRRIETSAMVVVEVLRGCTSQREESDAIAFFREPDIVTMDHDVALIAGQLLRRFRSVFSSEKAVPDAIIAASAITTSAELVALNTRQFSGLSVPGLHLMLIDQGAADWTADL